MERFKVKLRVKPQFFVSTLVLFYMPRCPWCIQFEPVFLECAEKWKRAVGLRVAAVDGTDDRSREKMRQMGIVIEGYPTLMYFDRHGTKYRMKGERTVRNVNKFIEYCLQRDVL